MIVQDFSRLVHWLCDFVVYFCRFVDFSRLMGMVGSSVVHSRLGLELVVVVGNCLRRRINWSFYSIQKHTHMHVVGDVVKSLFRF